MCGLCLAAWANAVGTRNGLSEASELDSSRRQQMLAQSGRQVRLWRSLAGASALVGVPALALWCILLVRHDGGSEDVARRADLTRYEAGELGGEQAVETYVVDVSGHPWYECYGSGGASSIRPPRPPQIFGRFSVTHGSADGPWGPNDRARFSVDGREPVVLFPWPTACATASEG